MTEKELLEKTFDSAYEAMYALKEFLEEINNPFRDEKISDYQHLRVIGNRIFS